MVLVIGTVLLLLSTLLTNGYECSYQMRREGIQVPNLVGLTVEQAREALDESSSCNSLEVVGASEGIVVSQTPIGSDMVIRPTIVTVRLADLGTESDGG